MTERGRRWAFGVAAACIAVVVAALLLQAPSRREDARPRTPDRPVEPPRPPESTTGAVPRPSKGRGTDVGPQAATRGLQAQRRAPRLPRSVQATATAFVHAFLRYEAGAAFSAVRRAFARHAEVRLVRDLRDAPPRAARGLGRPQRGSLASIGPAGEALDGELLVTATIVYQQGRSEMLITMRRAAGVWRVAKLR